LEARGWRQNDKGDGKDMIWMKQGGIQEIGELQTKLSQNIIGISNKYFMNLLMSFLSKIGQLMRYF